MKQSYIVKRIRGIKRSTNGQFLSSPPNYQYLLDQFECVGKWYEEKLQCERTRDTYMRLFLLVIESTGVNPDELLQKTMLEARELIWSVVVKYKNEHPVKARTMVAALKSFWRYHKINQSGQERLTFDTSKGGAHEIRMFNKKSGKQYIPKKNEVYRMADVGNIRDRAMILMLFHSGVRVSALCSLNFGHVRHQLYPTPRTFTLPSGKSVVSVRLKITNEIDTKLKGYGLGYYYCFLQEEAVLAIKEYCDQYHKNSTDDTPLFYRTSGKRVDRNDIYEYIQKCVRKARLKGVWTHVIRKATNKVFNKAEAEGKIDDDTKESLLGHKLSGSRANYWDYKDIDEIEAKYHNVNFSSKNEFSEEMVKQQVIEYLGRTIPPEVRNLVLQRCVTTPTMANGGGQLDVRVVKVPIHDVDQYIEYRKQGYRKDLVNNEYIVMVKE